MGRFIFKMLPITVEILLASTKKSGPNFRELAGWGSARWAGPARAVAGGSLKGTVHKRNAS
jgi:hypothetical protein